MIKKLVNIYCIAWYIVENTLLHPYFLIFLTGILFCRIVQIAW